MAFDLTTRIRGNLDGWSAGGGHKSSGAAANQKTVIVGDINITTYTAGGEPVTAADLGLETLDCILLEVVTVDGSLPTATNIHKVNYDYTAEQILAWDGAAFATVPDGSPDTVRVRFAAFGDSAAAPELT
jgi:hypothetical protein